MNSNELNLTVGTRIKIGAKYAAENPEFKQGEIITLIEGWFHEDNGLYVQDVSCPAIEADEGEYESIYHLFGNHFEFFSDCEVVEPSEKANPVKTRTN